MTYAIRQLAICPRCKQRVLNHSDCGESGLYGSAHDICVPCFHDEFDEIDREGSNDLPERLKSYGYPNQQPDGNCF